jgi:hypothetical protein
VQTPLAKVPPLLKQSSALMQLPMSVFVALELVHTELQDKNVVSMLTPWHTSTGPWPPLTTQFKAVAVSWRASCFLVLTPPALLDIPPQLLVLARRAATGWILVC